MFSNLVQIMLIFLIEGTRITFKTFSGNISMQHSIARYQGQWNLWAGGAASNGSDGYRKQAINNRGYESRLFWGLHTGQHIKIT